jgi:anti-sigma factor RsiW
MSTQRPLMTDQDLWRSLAVEDQAPPGTVSDMDLAAWLEGRLPSAEAARVDSILAADPVQRAAAVELSEILALPLPTAPARLVVRARALVDFEVERQVPTRPGFFAALFAAARRQAPRNAAMATAGAMLAVSGFLMGGGLGESFVAQKQPVTGITATLISSSDAPSEMTDMFSDANVI